MRYALISDIHSNIEAFNSVLESIRTSNVDKIAFLGDIIGYGPNPNECMEKLREVTDLVLGGNHDWAVVGKTPADYFNPYAKAAVDWTGEVLLDTHKKFLAQTEASSLLDGFFVAHSTPRYPEEWMYIMTKKDAVDNYPFLERNVSFIGHSHQPVIIEFENAQDINVYREDKMALDHDKKYIVNIGSVGQPRDGDPRSCWVLFDSLENSVEFVRVSYNIEAVQEKMREFNLPKYLIDRLIYGR